MSQISIRIPDNQEIELKRAARESKQTLAQFCREKILSDTEPDTLDRVTVEAQIDELKAQIRQSISAVQNLQRFVYEMEKESCVQMRFNAEMSDKIIYQMFVMGARDKEAAKRQAAKLRLDAESAAEQYVKENFSD